MSDFRDAITRARKAQQKHDRRIPVQLQIETPSRWATEDEVREEFHRTTFDVPQEPVLHLILGGGDFERATFENTKPTDTPGVRVDRWGENWYSAEWL